MSDFVRQTAQRTAAAAREARTLVTAMLPVVVFGMTREGLFPASNFSDTLGVLAGDAEYAQIHENVSGVLNSIGLRDDPAVSDLPQLMSAVQTAVFVVRYAQLLGEDPHDVWQKYVTEMTHIECQLEN